MFSKRHSLLISKGKPLQTRQPLIEVRASSTGEFIKADKFEKSEQGGSSICNFVYCATAVQGFRSRIQDDYICIPELEVKGTPYAHFGVFDGHGDQGEVVSQYCADHILKQLLSRKALRHSKVITNELLAASVHKTMVKLDSQLRLVEGEDGKPQFESGGTTACFVLISQDDIMFVNIGDSRALLCRDGAVVFETRDHNPDVPEEEARITSGGGKIYTTPSKYKVVTDAERINNLSVSRTLGDFAFKPPSTLPPELQPVTSAPDIDVVSRNMATDEFLVIASDGVFKSLSSVKVVEFVRQQLLITDDLSKVCRNLIDTAYFAADNIPDDTTIVLIKFPAAPTVSQQAVAEEDLLEHEAIAAIEEELKDMIGRANVVQAVDNDFALTQRLVHKLPEKYRVQQRVAFIMETANKLRMEKFGSTNEAGQRQSQTETERREADKELTTINTCTSSDPCKLTSTQLASTSTTSEPENRTTTSDDSKGSGCESVDQTVIKV